MPKKAQARMGFTHDLCDTSAVSWVQIPFRPESFSGPNFTTV